ncbi:flagellar export chaperone FliS [Actinoplanes flavus]|uniref:Flagellar export chaperone FliS n=1 Tax=Actinoplanes flavus TaxID=2820290 RepID=A0ABS3URR7_9ACTN|nr:flagellar export chaperone FliS [Actinoplanes flavus]MBO3740642.1 flagellar export chaperone FliS [Actinoplanes flavus]
MSNLRDRYLQDSINTASPAKLLMMLYDRLVLDLMQGEEALRGGDRESANNRIGHAQEIVMELHASLKLDAWDGAPGLANLYSFMLTELIGANVKQDADRVAGCRKLVEPLRDAWREAALAPA